MTCYGSAVGVVSLCAALLFANASSGADYSMDTTGLRLTEDFGKGWRFLKGDSSGAAMPHFDDSGWESVVIPHCFNAEDTFDATRGYYRGLAWYRKRFPFDKRFAGRRVHLVCDGSFAVTRVYVNGTEVGNYCNGFTGFCVDITERLDKTGANCIAIQVDNSHNPDVLPGRKTPDYNLYGGIYREVYLVVTDPAHFPFRPVFVKTPEIDRGSGRVEMEITVENSTDREKTCEVQGTVCDSEKKDVASSRGTCRVPPRGVNTLTLETTVSLPRLWSPEEPNLYEVSLVVHENGVPRDEVSVPFGFRWFRFDANEGFSLNGKRVRLGGVNRHQCYPGLGSAVPKSLQVKDAELIKDMGCNFVRLSHYPQHPAFPDACDRLGILVYEEIASWQFIGGPKFAENAVSMMEAMVRRDRNHPSIILWGLFNEGRNASLFRVLNETAHKNDPTRLTIYAENRPDEGTRLGTTMIPDVLGINYEVSRLDEIHAALPVAKLLSSEYANADVAVRGDLELELKQVEAIKRDLDSIESHGYMAGSALWSMHDYGTDYEPVWPVQHSGILDMYRIPKEAYYYLKSRFSESPFVHIIGHWTWLEQEGKPRPVTVWSNCDEVELFLNGVSLGSRRATDGFDWSVPFRPGVLKAVARTAAGSVSDAVATAGASAKIELSGEPTTLQSDGVSVSVITARIVDRDGNLVPSANHGVRFEVQGDARIRGIGGKPESIAAGGIARIVVQAGLSPGEVVITATAPDLEPGTVRLRSIAR